MPKRTPATPRQQLPMALDVMDDPARFLQDLSTIRHLVGEIAARYRTGNGSSGAERVTIHSPREAITLIGPEMAVLDQESLRVICLNSKNAVLDVHELYRGTVNSSTVRIAELFRAAIALNATGVIVVHNHPSGDPTPSPEDVRVTTEAVKAGQLLDVEVLDHIVVGSVERWISLKERGLGFA